MNPRAFLWTLTLIAGCASAIPQQPADCQPFRVMSYNIRLNLASDGPNAWPHRKDAVASLVRFHGADLLGVQEALPEQLRDLDERLPGFSRFGVGRTAARSGEHSAIYFRTNRFELLADETFWLSPTPGVAGSKGWDAAYERIVTWGRLRDRQTGRTLYYFNTHFDHVGVEARRESARLLRSRIEQLGRDSALVVTGDFNDVPGSDPYDILLGAGLQDAFITSIDPHHGPASTWNAFQRIETGRRIDFIFVNSRLDVIRHGVLAEILEDGRFPSDHLPLLAELRDCGR